LRPEQNRDAASLFTMFRNVAGSIGIAVSTSAVTEFSQKHQAHLSEHLSSLNQPYLDTLARNANAITAQGVPVTSAANAANGVMLKGLMIQSQVMAYSDIFVYCAIFALLSMPLAFLFPPTKAGGKGRPGAAE
jgi:DHA2 family multidrug resistance protein